MDKDKHDSKSHKKRVLGTRSKDAIAQPLLKSYYPNLIPKIDKVIEVFKQGIIIYDKIYSTIKEYAKIVIGEQKTFEEDFIDNGFAYFSNYHLLWRLGDIDEVDSMEEVVDKLLETGMFDDIFEQYNEYEKHNSNDFIAKTFKSFNKENIILQIPFLVIFIERLSRLLIDKLDDDIQLKGIKSILNDTVIKHKDSNSEDKENSDYSKLMDTIDDNAKALYVKTYQKIIEKDFYMYESGAKGNIVNRHTILHGKYNYDSLSYSDVVKITCLIFYLLELLELKEKGILIVQFPKKV